MQETRPFLPLFGGCHNTGFIIPGFHRTEEGVPVRGYGFSEGMRVLRTRTPYIVTPNLRVPLYLRVRLKFTEFRNLEGYGIS